MRYHDIEGFAAASAAAVAAAGERAFTREIGRSVEGRPVTAVTIAPPGAEPDPQRPQALVSANIHGAEVIASEVALGVIDELTAAVPAGPAAELLAAADVTVVGVVNPDARERAVASLRRSPWRVAPRRNSRGVDLNRNFPFPPEARDVWHPLSGTGLAWLPWYRGPAPLSEPETAALAALASELEPVAAVNLHSAGRLFLYPYCYKAEPPADLAAFLEMGEAFTAAQPRHRYRVRQSRSWYAILGDLDDWLYDNFATLSVTVEIGLIREGLGPDPRRLLRPFWWANPPDPKVYVDNDARACCAALAVGCRRRSGK